MGKIKFARGLAKFYTNSQGKPYPEYKDTVYFTTDTHLIMYNGDAFGDGTGSAMIDNLNNKIIKSVDVRDNIVTFTKGDDSTFKFGLNNVTETTDNAIRITSTPGTDFGTDYSVALNIDEHDNVLTQSENGLLTSLSLAYDKVNQKINLVGKNDVVLSEINASDFVKDGFLQSVEHTTNAAGENVIRFSWNIKLDDTGTEQAGVTVTDIKVSDLFQAYTNGDGLSLNGTTFSIKIATDSEGFLSADENGLKLSGVQAAIDSVKVKDYTVQNIEGESISDRQIANAFAGLDLKENTLAEALQKVVKSMLIDESVLNSNIQANIESINGIEKDLEWIEVDSEPEFVEPTENDTENNTSGGE
jgi:hypothetical protein